jgi:hypothetical protein
MVARDKNGEMDDLVEQYKGFATAVKADLLEEGHIDVSLVY